MDLGGRENENDIGRRFFDSFQESVECTVGEHMNFVDNVNFITCAVRREENLVLYFPHIVDGGVRGAVDFDDVESITPCYFGTVGARPAGILRRAFFTVQGLREQSRRRGLPDSPGAGKEIGVGDSSRPDGVFQGGDDKFLARQFIEKLGPFSGSCNFVGHNLI